LTGSVSILTMLCAIELVGIHRQPEVMATLHNPIPHLLPPLPGRRIVWIALQTVVLVGSDLAAQLAQLAQADGGARLHMRFNTFVLTGHRLVTKPSPVCNL